MGRKNSKTVTNSKTVAIDQKIGKWADKKAKDCTKSVNNRH